MYKKFVLVLVLATLLAGGVFAQARRGSTPKNWISGEVSIFGVGARYERMLNNSISLGANTYWNTLILWNEIEVGGSFRYYIFPVFFIGAGLGFHIHTGFYDYEIPGSKGSYNWMTGHYDPSGTTTVEVWGSVWGVGITPEIGWKIDVGSRGGFFVQPGIKIPVTLGKLSAYLSVDGGFKVGFGVVPYCGLGYAW